MNLVAGQNIQNVSMIKTGQVILAAADSSSLWKSQATEICPGVGMDETVFAKYPNALLATGKYEVGVWLPANNSKTIGLSPTGTTDTEIHLNNGVIYLGDRSPITNIELGNFKLTGTLASGFSSSLAICSPSNNIYIHPIVDTVPGCDHFVLYANGNPGYGYGATITNVTFDHCISQNADGFGFMNNGEGPGTLIDTVNYLYCEEYNAGVASTRNGDWVCGIDFAEYGGLTVKNLYAIGCIADGAWESCYHTEESPTKINFQIIDCVAKNGGKKPTALYGAGFLWCFERAGETFYLENCSGSNNKLGDLRLLNDAGSAFIDYTPIPALVNQGITP